LTVPFLTVKPKSIKLKVSPRFPAQVIGRTGIDVNKTGGNYYFDLDYAAFPKLLTPTAGTYIAQFDPNTHQFSIAPSASFSGGAIPDAPSDSTAYGRRNAAWVQVLPLTGGTLSGALTVPGLTVNGNSTVTGTLGVTGILTAPTAAVNTNTTQVATTAFVIGQGYAPLASPTFTGTPAAPTPATADNTTKLATTAFVKANIVVPNQLTASLGADVALNNTANYFDGPSIAQGSTGTWYVSGTVTVTDTGGSATFHVKLWDGTTIIASAATTINAATLFNTITLSGYLASPAGNLRISVKDNSNTTGKVLFNQTGNSKDSTISAYRIA
jgi:hypothetical protein